MTKKISFFAKYGFIILFQPIGIGYRSYITIIKELSGKSPASEPLYFFVIVIYDL